MVAGSKKNLSVATQNTPADSLQIFAIQREIWGWIGKHVGNKTEWKLYKTSYINLQTKLPATNIFKISSH